MHVPRLYLIRSPDRSKVENTLSYFDTFNFAIEVDNYNDGIATRALKYLVPPLERLRVIVLNFYSLTGGLSELRFREPADFFEVDLNEGLNPLRDSIWLHQLFPSHRIQC